MLAVSAQPVPNSGQLLNEVQKSERELSTRTEPPELIQPSTPRPAIKFPEGVRIDVASFRITGAKVFDVGALQELVRPWGGRSLDVNELNDAAGAITRYYQSSGYLLAYAYLPVQRIEGGVVEIAVLEGTVSGVQLVTAQDVRIRDEVIQGHFDGMANSPQVTQADLERRLLLLNDIPGVVARASFAPGSVPGTAEVIVTVAEEEPLISTVDLNNHGSESTGVYRLGAQFQFRNLFGLGDNSRLRLQASPNLGLATGSITTKVPVTGDGWSVDGGISHLIYELGAPYSQLGARGEANTLKVGVSHQLIRGVSESLAYSMGYEYKELSDVLELISTNRKNAHVVSLGFNASARDTWGGGGVTQSNLSWVNGDMQWQTANLNRSPAGYFQKLTFDVSRRQAVVENVSLLIRASGQLAQSNLDSSEKLALTGPGAVRAYAPGLASVDTGSIIGLDLRKTWPFSGGTLTGSVFYDYANGNYDAKPAAVNGNSIHLRGYGLGLAWANSADLDISLTAASRDSRQLSANYDRLPTVYFQISKGF